MSIVVAVLALTSLSLSLIFPICELLESKKLSSRVSSHLHHSLQASNLFLLHILHSPIQHNHYHFIHSFITEIYIAPLQGYYSEALPTLARLKRRVLRVE